MSGGKGGSTTSSVTIPEYIEAAAQRNLNKAERISQIGYTPYYGPDVAAFTPMQQAGFQNIANTAGAFGMAAPTAQQDIMGGMGPATTYAGGVQGYSSAPIYEQSLATLGQQRPGQRLTLIASLLIRIPAAALMVTLLRLITPAMARWRIKLRPIAPTNWQLLRLGGFQAPQ